MTPAELNLYARAQGERIRAEQKAVRGNLYSLSVLIRAMVWAKSPPSYETAFPGDETAFPGDAEKPKDMTDDEIYATIRALNAAMGGKEVD